ncbi:MAG TPA: FapA family protein [bacterium]|nr:FapA family protein [bacterium]HPN30608.1 FapA family protein [bacterium]
MDNKKNLDSLKKFIIDYEIKNAPRPLEFAGNVVLFESINNSTLKAKGHIIVHGGCGKSKLISENGSVFLLFGSMQEANISAGQNIFVKHTQNSILKAKSDIIIENSVFKSELYAGNKIISESFDAKIIGGKITAGKEVVINSIGNEQGVETFVTVLEKEGFVLADAVYPGTNIALWKLNGIRIKTHIKSKTKFFVKDNQIAFNS